MLAGLTDGPGFHLITSELGLNSSLLTQKLEYGYSVIAMLYPTVAETN